MDVYLLDRHAGSWAPIELPRQLRATGNRLYGADGEDLVFAVRESGKLMPGFFTIIP
jgi:hypothetical protein